MSYKDSVTEEWEEEQRMSGAHISGRKCCTAMTLSRKRSVYPNKEWNKVRLNAFI
jgi:hypothetical protein